jgi:L-proline amide hydrolase
MNLNTQVTEGVVTWRNHKTWYEQRGQNGVALVLLAGGPGASSNYFTPLSERMAARSRRVVRYDPIGTGNSDRDRHDEGWTIELFLDELQALRDHLALDHVDLLGHSWGGWLALEHVLHGADGVRSLILYSSSASVPHTCQEMRSLVHTLPKDAKQAILEHEAQGTYEAEAYQQAMMVFMRRHFCRLDPWPAILNRKGFGDDVYVSMWGPSEFTCTGTLMNWDVTERLGEVSIPVLILSGAYDEMTLPLQRELEVGLANARRVTFHNSAHMSHLEEPDQFDQAVEEFLKSIDAG